MSDPNDTGLQDKIAAMERELAALRRLRDAAILNTGPGVAFEGDRNLVNTGSIGGNVQIFHGNVYNGPPITDPVAALRIYCQVLVAGSRYLPLRGVDVGAADPSTGQQPLNLARVYIALDTTAMIEAEALQASLQGDPTTHYTFTLEQARVIEHVELLNPGKTRGDSVKLPALLAVARTRHTVILGDPGSGKSTFVMHLAHCLAAHRLEPQAGWLDHLSGWVEADTLPVIIVLRDFARWLAAKAEANVKIKAEPSLVWEYLVGRLQAQNLEFVAEPLRTALEDGRAFLLFDGLDEIAGRASPGLVRDAVAVFAGRYAGCRSLITCRTLSYRASGWQIPDYPAFELAPFDEAKIDQFVAAWYAELAEQGVVPSGDVPALTKALGAALRRPDLWRLAPNPLLLTVMALVHTHKGRLPDARALLYEETVDILLWRWDQLKGSDETPPLRQLLLQANRGEVDLKPVLWKLAFEAHSQGGAGDDGEKLADIGELRLLKELGGLCCGDMGWAQRVVDAMKLRAGLLVERQPEIFTFPHRTFQEYLAGAHLAAQDDFARRAAGLVAEGANWREVILLAAGKLVYRNDDLNKPRALVAELCPRKRHDTELAWRKAWLAGDVLLEAGVNRVQDTELGRELLERVQERLVDLVTLGRLVPVERARAADALGRLGDPRPGVGLRPDGVPDIAWCEVPAGKFVMGSRDDEPALGKETPQHMLELPAFRIGKYPITNAQFGAFVQDGGYTARWRHCWTHEGWQWKSDRNEPDKLGGVYHLPNHPAVMVTWYEAMAFCSWLGERLGIDVALPSEAQWEKAARGVDGRTYPWGETLTPDHATYGDTGIGATTAVGIFPKGTSPCGVSDMSGNVWEWTRSLWGEEWQKPSFNYPYVASDGRENPNAPDRVLRVLRGGAFYYDARFVRCAFRLGYDPSNRSWYFGFRVLASPDHS